MRILLLLSILTVTTGDSYCQRNNQQATIITTLDFAYLEKCETGKGDCKPVEIIRSSTEDSLLLIFPSGGTSSDVYLRSSKDKTLELHDKKTTGQGSPRLNLTNLADGEYSASIISCGLGGGCLIRLITKPKHDNSIL